MKCIAVIPARGGSKRIPRKNVLPIGGKPLIAWTIEAALDCENIDHVFVSTEDAEIARVSRHYGAEIIPRPVELALDTAASEPVLLHALDWLLEVCNINPEYLAMLQCTSPLRGADVIERAIDKIIELDCDAVVGVHPTIDYYFSGALEGDRFMVDYDPLERLRTQDIARQYRENGSVYVTRSAFLRQTGCRMGGDTRGVVMTPKEGLDIDNHHDLAVAQHHLDLLQRHSMSLPVLSLAI